MAIATRTIRTTFEALENRNFRWLWLGRLASSGTFQMGSVAQGWLVYHITGSAFALGWVGAGWSVATLLLAPYGGVVADRMDKRGLMLWNRAGMFVNSLVIGLLISLGAIQIWHLAVSSFFTGIFIAFLMPAQQAIVSELVERRTLMNAVSLDALGMGLMGVFAASLAGLVIEHIGVAGVYYLMAGMYLAAVFTISRLPRTLPHKGEHSTVWADLIAGARYLGSNTTLLMILGLGLTRVFFVMPYTMLLPAFASDNLGLDAVGLGMLRSSAGVGAMLASLIACTMGDIRHKGRVLLGSGLALGASLVAFVTVPWLPLVFVFLALVGAFSNLYMVVSNTLLLTYSDAAYRGRVLSIGMMEFGLTPAGTIPAGAIADRVGVPWVVGVQGMVVTVAFLATGLLKPQIRRMD